MNETEDPDDTHESLAVAVATYDPPTPAPLHISPWVAMSLLQKAIRRREIGGIVSTTASVLATPEAPRIGMYRTTTTYFYHEAKLYSDAMSVLVAPDERHGYTPIYTDEMGQDLFGDRDRLEAALLKSTHPAGAAAR